MTKATSKLSSAVFLAALALVSLQPAHGQQTLTTTTTSAAVAGSDSTVNLTSVSGITAPYPNNEFRTVIAMDRELMAVTQIVGNTVYVTRGYRGTARKAHISGATVYVGPDDQYHFSDAEISGACTATNIPVLPVFYVPTGQLYTCTNAGRWGVITTFVVPAANCSYAPTTLTTTNILTQIGASNIMVSQGTSNAAAGTLTLTCNITLPTNVSTGNGAQIMDITAFTGFQTTAPSSIGTATLGGITMPVAASSETASTVTPVALGGTVTLTGPAAPSTTTAGAFLSYKATFSTPVFVQTDLQVLQFTIPFVQSATTATVVNTPGLMVHYVPSPDPMP